MSCFSSEICTNVLFFNIFRNVDLFLDGWIDNRVRVLIFGKTEIARLRYLTTAFKYRSRAQVGYVKIDDPESIEVVSKYEIPGDSDSLLLFQENTRIPVVRISMQVRISQKLCISDSMLVCIAKMCLKWT